MALLLGSTWQLWRRSEGLDTAALLCMQICLAAGAAILLSELQESEPTTASLSLFVLRFVSRNPHLDAGERVLKGLSSLAISSFPPSTNKDALLRHFVPNKRDWDLRANTASLRLPCGLSLRAWTVLLAGSIGVTLSVWCQWIFE